MICCCSVLEVSSLSDRTLLRRGGGRCHEQTPPDGLLQEVGVEKKCIKLTQNLLTTRRLRCRITLYDYQALCKEYTGSSDSARTLSDVSVGDRTAGV